MTGDSPRRVGDPHTIRFPPDIAQALYRMAAQQGKSHSELVREIVGQEIARREGCCPTCGMARVREAAQ